MIGTKDIQSSLKRDDFYRGPIDGTVSPQVIAAIRNCLDNIIPAARGWSDKRLLVGYQQWMMQRLKFPVGKIDGFAGPQTLYALEKWQDRLRAIPGPASQGIPVKQSSGRGSTSWPRQSQCTAFYGKVGTSQVRLTPPYPLYLYDTRQRVNTISVHRKVHDSTLRVLRKVLNAYGQEEINRLHLNRFFGSLSVRKMRGGSSWSMHAWGIAFDFDANRNQLRWGRDRAAFGKAAYKKWFEAWESEGAISLGRERNYDFMHTQFARL